MEMSTTQKAAVGMRPNRHLKPAQTSNKNQPEKKRTSLTKQQTDDETRIYYRWPHGSHSLTTSICHISPQL
jgi:hypothetical protein